jgi:hypothetical protein
LIANTVQGFDKTIMLSFGASSLSRAGKARVYMDLVRSDQDKNWSDALVPKYAVEPRHLLRFNLFNLPKVDDRGLLQAEDAIQLELFKSPS